MCQVDTTKNYELLAAAIIRNAVKDYERGRKLTKRRIIGCSKWVEGQELIDDVKRFFHSQWFVQLSKCDGPAMFKQIEENYDKYGKCMPFQKKDDEDTGE